MVNIFRKMKKKVIQNPSVNRYLLYALGEITLIFIGIMIALQFNNWNENRRADEQTKIYLQNLIVALEDDISFLNNTINYNNFRLNGIFYILRYAGLNDSQFADVEWRTDLELEGKSGILWEGKIPDSLNRDFTDKAFCQLGRGFGSVAFNYSVINELHSTGSFSHIYNQELKSFIARYYRHLQQRMEGYAIEEHEQWANEVTNYLRDHYGIFTLDVTRLEDPIGLIAGKNDVEIRLRYLAMEVNYHINWALSARMMARELVDELKEELSKP
jgi:hypothetical protein